MTESTPRPVLLQPDEITPAVKSLKGVLAALDRVLLGQPELHRMVLAGI